MQAGKKTTTKRFTTSFEQSKEFNTATLCVNEISLKIKTIEGCSSIGVQGVINAE